MISVEINRSLYAIKRNLSVLEGCKYLGLVIPRFCYHETLSVAGNCRMCLVEVVMGSASQKPVVSCALPFLANMKILLDTPLLQKARANVVEMLLLYHPLDCPVCDQAGECDLQDQTKIYGSRISRHFFHKRGVENKNSGVIVKTIMSRCIHCTRCVRFNQEVMGNEIIGTINRGVMTEISSYDLKPLHSEIAGNIVDLCPVGALTLKPYAFKTRPWELKISESIDLTDSLGSSIFVYSKNLEIFRILPKVNALLNETIISDKARFFYDTLHYNRLKCAYKKGKVDLIENTLFEIFKTIQSKKALLILCNSEISVEILFMLKLLAYRYSFFTLKSVDAEQKKPNFYLGSIGLVNSVFKDISVCLLFSLNLQIESVLLNYRLRKKSLQKNLKVYAFLNFCTTNNFSTFINLNVKSFTALCKGKLKFLSSLIVHTAALSFLLGESLYNRGFSILKIINLFKQINLKSQFLFISTKCNSEGTKFSNIKLLTTNDLIKTKTTFLINLNSNLWLTKFILSKLLTKFWFTTHSSSVLSNISYAYPLATSYESTGLFLNCEARPQLCSQIFLAPKFIEPFDKLCKLILKLSFKTPLKNTLEFLHKEKTLSLATENFMFNRRFSFYNLILNLTSSKVSTYPLKVISYDHYLLTNNCNNSKVLVDCSIELRKKFNQTF